jgi:hypothetical protein
VVLIVVGVGISVGFISTVIVDHTLIVNTPKAPSIMSSCPSSVVVDVTPLPSYDFPLPSAALGDVSPLPSYDFPIPSYVLGFVSPLPSATSKNLDLAGAGEAAPAPRLATN